MEGNYTLSAAPSTVVTVSPGVGSSGFTSRAVVFASSVGALTEDPASFNWDSTLNALVIGSSIVPSAGGIDDANLYLLGSSFLTRNWVADAAQTPTYVFMRSSGTIAAPGDISSGNILGRFLFQARVNSSFHNAAEIRSGLPSTSTVASGRIDGNLQFFANGTLGLTVASSGRVGVGTTLPTGAFQVDNGAGSALLYIPTGTTFVGIGTTNPTEKLHMQQTGSQLRALIDNISSAVGASGSLMLQTLSTLGTTMTLDMRINSTGSFIKTAGVAGAGTHPLFIKTTAIGFFSSASASTQPTTYTTVAITTARLFASSGPESTANISTFTGVTGAGCAFNTRVAMESFLTEYLNLARVVFTMYDDLRGYGLLR